MCSVGVLTLAGCGAADSESAPTCDGRFDAGMRAAPSRMTLAIEDAIFDRAPLRPRED
jgi:hypothetical protein